MIDGAEILLEDFGKRGRYSYRLEDGSEAEMTFIEDAPGIVTILHTYTPPKHRGQGVADALVARAIADFRKADRKVIPACWFAGKQFDLHPEWSDLLARR